MTSTRSGTTTKSGTTKASSGSASSLAPASVQLRFAAMQTTLLTKSGSINFPTGK